LRRVIDDAASFFKLLERWPSIDMAERAVRENAELRKSLVLCREEVERQKRLKLRAAERESETG
jgi:hypothetical protein